MNFEGIIYATSRQSPQFDLKFASPSCGRGFDLCGETSYGPYRTLNLLSWLVPVISSLYFLLFNVMAFLVAFSLSKKKKKYKK